MKICVISKNATYGNVAILAEGLRKFAQVHVIFFEKDPKDMYKQTDCTFTSFIPRGYDHYLFVGVAMLRNMPIWVQKAEKTVILTDTAYLRKHEHYNSIFKKYNFNVWAMPDLAKLAGTNQIYYQPFIIPKGVKQIKKTKDICHSPFYEQKHCQKGTGIIKRIVSGITVIEGMKWNDAIKEKAKHKICIDQLHQGIGKSGLEAMLLGCVVLSGRKPDCNYLPPVIWTSPETLEKDLNIKDFEKHKQKQIKWAKENLTPEFVAKRIYDTINIDVLMICVSDNCHRTWKMQQALLAQNINVKAFALQAKQIIHKTNKDNIPVITLAEMQRYCNKAKVVWATMGNYTLLNRLKFTSPVIATHAGTTYRNNYKVHNALFNRMVDKHVLLGHDHMELGANNAVYNCCRIIDIDYLQPNYNKSEKYIIGHYPSQPDKKGTQKIINCLNELKSEGFDFIDNVDTKLVSFEDNVKRMSKCDIYIEQLAPTVEGKMFGEISNTAYEAASLGCAVVTNLINDKYYNQRHGEHKFHIANNEKELKKLLKYLLSLSREELNKLQVEARKFIVNKHSFKPMGKELLKDVEEYLKSPKTAKKEVCGERKTIIMTLRSGGDFAFSDVTLLANHIHKKWKSEVAPRIICMYDKIKQPIDLGNIELIPIPNQWPGVWARMSLYSPEMRDLRPFLYIDLDTAVINNLENIIKLIDDESMYITLEDFWQPGKLATGLAWIPKDSKKVNKIWDIWLKSSKQFKGRMDNFLRTCVEPDAFFQQLNNKKIVTFKPKVKRQLGSTWLRNIPPDVDLVCFHGYPRIPQATEVEWVKKYINE
ncbi:MAG: hypothetical protein R6U11_06730 [Bacteroidales bacterium]